MSEPNARVHPAPICLNPPPTLLEPCFNATHHSMQARCARHSSHVDDLSSSNAVPTHTRTRTRQLRLCTQRLCSVCEPQPVHTMPASRILPTPPTHTHTHARSPSQYTSITSLTQPRATAQAHNRQFCSRPCTHDHAPTHPRTGSRPAVIAVQVGLARPTPS